MHCGIMHGKCEKHSKNEQNYFHFSIILLIFWMFFTFVVHDTTMRLLWFRLSHMLFNQCLHVDWLSEHSFECVRTYFWKILNKKFFIFLVEFWFLKFQIFISLSSTVWRKSGRTWISLRCKIFSSNAMSMKKISHVADT